jgi:hypothetical protein
MYRRKQMNRWTRNALRSVLVSAVALLLQLVPAAAQAAAPPELTGVWQGKLAVDASNSLAVQFTFTKGANGAYTAVLNSPDNPSIKNTPVSGVSWDGTNLKLQVPTLSGSYAGALKDGKVTGQWTQQGTNLPLVLAPYQKPVVTAAAARSITGAWNGVLTVGPITQNLMFQFKQGAGGVLEGSFSIPDQGLNGVAASNVVFENGELSLKVQVGPQLLDYKGKLAGEQITGVLKAAGLPPDGAAVTFKRGEYKVVAPALKIDAAAFAAVKGRWQGSLEVPMPAQAQAAGQPTSVKLGVTVRFETGAKGEYIGYLALTEPGQAAGNNPGFPIAEAQFAAGKLTLKIAIAAAIEYTATVSGGSMTGTWVQTTLGRNIPLNLTRQ